MKSPKEPKTLTIRQARQSLASLEVLLEKEGEVTITRRGKPVARLLPIASPRRPMPTHRKLRERMARFGRASERLIREERDAR